MPTKKITLYYETEDGDEERELEVPARWEICSRCDGEGHHSDPAIDGNGITQSEWAEWDEEDRHNYMSGAYDVCCKECSGSGKQLVVDAVAFKEKSPEDFRRWHKAEKDEQEYRHMADSEARWERRMLYGSDY